MATGEHDLRDDDRLPWLETADDDFDEGPSIGRIALLVGVGLLLIAAAILGVHWYKNRAEPAGGGGALIAAQEGDYKVKPDEPGGMKVEGEGDTAFATSEGAAGNSGAAIDLRAVPEAPVSGTRAGPAKAPSLEGKTVAVPASGGALTAGATGAAPMTRPVAVTVAGGAVQLGSFASEAEANGAWGVLSRRFGYVSALPKSIERAEVNGRNVFRLRVAAGNASAAATLCGKLKVAGEECFVAR
jgi:hypothetical protein